MGATLTADTDGTGTGHDTSNPVGLLAVTRTTPAIRPRVETPPSHRQSRSEQRNEQNPGHVAMSDTANNNPKPPDSHNRSPTSGRHITWTHNRVPSPPPARRLRDPGEWREGTSPSRSLRTVRDSLPSYGSHSPAQG